MVVMVPGAPRAAAEAAAARILHAKRQRAAAGGGLAHQLVGAIQPPAQIEEAQIPPGAAYAPPTTVYALISLKDGVGGTSCVAAGSFYQLRLCLAGMIGLRAAVCVVVLVGRGVWLCRRGE